MAQDIERLVVQLSADINRYEKALNKAQGFTNSQTKKIEGRFKRMNTNLSASFAQVGAAFAAKFIAPLAALGAAGLIREVGQVARGVAEIGDEARRAGLSLQTFQELKYVAEQNRIGVDALTDGIKELNLRADEFIVTGGGSAAESFQRLGYDAETLGEKLKDPSALFTEIIGKLEGLDRAAQIRIADELFGGTGGEQFVQLIDQGADGIQDAIDRAHELGIIMSDELIDKAAELDEKFNDVAATVGTALKTAIVEAASALSGFLDLFNSADRMSSENLEALLKAERDTRQSFGTPGTASFDQSLQREAEIIAELQKRAYGTLRTGLAELPSNRRRPPPPPGDSSVTRETDQVLKFIDALEFERDSLGLTARELAVANALRSAGAAATVDQRREIEALVLANFDFVAAQDAATQSTQEFVNLSRDAARGLIDDLREGKTAAEALSNVFGKIGDQLLDMSLNTIFGGGGGSFGLLGSLFGLGGGGLPINLLSANGNVFSAGKVTPFAKGGVVSSPTMFAHRGGAGLMGEAGDEAIMPLMRSPNGKLGVAAMGGGMSVLRVELDDGLEARMLQQSGRQTIQIVDARVPPMIKQGAPAAVAQRQRNKY